MKRKKSPGRPVKPRADINREALRDAREEQGISQAKIGKRCGGYTGAAVSAWEKGDRTPSEPVAIKWGKALNITEDKLWK